MNEPTTKDAGWSLVELVAYLALSILVLSVLIPVFLTATKTQAATKNRDVAAGTSQVVVNSVQTSVRNASSFTITGNLLRVRMATGNGTDWQCRAWALTPSGALVTKTATTAISVPTDYTGWTTLASGVAAGLAGSGGAAATVFATDGSSGVRLNYAFTVTTGSGASAASVTVRGGAVAQAKGTGSPSACW